MFEFDKIDLQRIAVSTVGAAILSTICVLAAFAPARANGATAQVVQTIR